MNKRRRLSALVSAFALVASVASAARAAEQAPYVSRAQSGELEEIVVTARKRTENLQDTPIAITALSGDALLEHGATNLADITMMAPGLSLQGSPPISGNSNAVTAFLRGIGQIDFGSHSDPGVGIYLDGVYLGSAIGGVLDLVDPERVEILRGPQGTLFGRNTIGGAISMVSRRPTSEFGGNVALTTGRFDRAQFRGTVNLPIGKNLLSSFSGLAHERDGYVDRPAAGDTTGDDGTLAGRVQLLWTPADTFDALLAVDGTRKRDNGAPMVAQRLDGRGTNSVAAGRPPSFAERFNAALFAMNGVSACDPGTPASPNPGFNPDSTQQCFGAAWETHSPYTTNSTAPLDNHLNMWGAALTLNWRLTENASLKSITARRRVGASFERDTDHTPFPYAGTINTVEQKQWSQELQLLSDAFSHRLHSVLGAYYYTQDAFDVTFSDVGFNGVLGKNTLTDDNYALFGEGTFDLTSRLHLTAGARYTHEKKTAILDQPLFARNPFTGVRTFIPGFFAFIDRSKQTLTQEQTDPRVTISYDFMEDLMGYVTYSRGFKSGGYNVRFLAAAPIPTITPFQPETVSLYESGVKFLSPGHMLRLNTAVFHMKYSDMQVTVNNPNIPLGNLIANAAAGHINGAEAELSLALTKALRLESAVSFLDTQYDELSPFVSGVTRDKDFLFAPRWSGNLGVAYQFNLGELGSLTLRTDGYSRSRTALDAANVHVQPGYTLLNAAANWDSRDGRWRVSAGGTNLTDKAYLISALASQSVGVVDVVYGRPREWYLSLRRDF